MAVPIPQNPNQPRNEMGPRPRRHQEPQPNLFIDEAHLPPGRVPLYVNRIFRWVFLLLVESFLAVLFFGIFSEFTTHAPEPFRPLLAIAQLA